MRKTLCAVGSLICVAVLAGCIPAKKDEWEPLPADYPPTDPRSKAEGKVPEWRVVWNDRERVWQRAGSADGDKIGHADVPTKSWVAEQDAIGFRVQASERLNYESGSSHTVALYVLQTQKPGKITRTFETPTSAYRLVRRGTDDPAVLALDREIIEPNREQVITIDRAKRARYLVLVVAGADFKARMSTRVIPIPQIYDVPRGAQQFKPKNLINALNPFKDSPDPRPGRILGWLKLGPKGIADLEMIAK